MTFVAHREVSDTTGLSPIEHSVGIDLGLRRFATFDDRGVVENPRFRHRAARKLQREHRRLARKKPASRNRARQRRRLNRAYARVRQQRTDFLHKLTTSLIRSFDLICLEDLNVRGLARAKLSRPMHDVAFREFRRQLEYKGAAAGVRVVVVDRFFPSSRRCSRCGRVNRQFQSTDLIWRCRCGLELDRDVNAARNLLQEGLRIAVAGNADAENARGAGVRPSTEGERHRSANP